MEENKEEIVEEKAQDIQLDNEKATEISSGRKLMFTIFLAVLVLMFLMGVSIIFIAIAVVIMLFFLISSIPDPNAPKKKTPTVEKVELMDKKIKHWRKIPIIFGIIVLIIYIIGIFSAKYIGGEYSGTYSFMFAMAFLAPVFYLSVFLTLISFLVVVIQSFKRRKHKLGDYMILIIGFVLVFSPFIISRIVSSVALLFEANNPYFITVSTSSDYVCESETSNEWLKSVEKKRLFQDSKNPKITTKEYYFEHIGNEILCQVGKFYEKNGRYPTESEIEKFSSQAVNNDIKSGVYNIKLEKGEKPNNKDFTIMFDKDCDNEETITGNIVVLSPHYGEWGRICIYNDIDTILGK